jgi:hypothetical protein
MVRLNWVCVLGGVGGIPHFRSCKLVIYLGILLIGTLVLSSRKKGMHVYRPQSQALVGTVWTIMGRTALVLS